MQEEQKKFQEKLIGLVACGKEQGGCLKLEQVREYFGEWKLNGQQLSMICDYLRASQIEVEGYEAGASFENPEEQAAKAAEPELSAEEEHDLKRYEAELPNVPFPDETERQELYRNAAQGDDLAKSRLTAAYLPVVIEIAKEVHTPQFFLGDLIQEGNVSLLLALEEVFGGEEADASIRSAIRQGMQEFMEESLQQKQQDDTVVGKVNRLKDAIEELSDGEELDFSIAELSAYLDMSVEEIEDILRLTGEGE